MIVGNLKALFTLDASGFAAGMSKVNSMTAGSARGLASLGGSVVKVGGAFTAVGAIAVAAGLKLAKMAASVDQIHRRLNVATGSAEAGARTFEFLASESNRLGISLEVAARGFGGLAAATKETRLEGEQTREIFTGIAEASAAMGLDAYRTELSFLAVQQMVSKTVISMEELRRQLGENLPGALQTMARSLGVSTQRLNKMVESGKLLAEDVLPLFAKQLRKENITAIEELGKSMAAALGRMQTAWFMLKEVLTEGAVNRALSLFVSFLTASIKNLTILLSSLNKLAAGFGSVAGSIVSSVSKVADSFMSFSFTLGGGEATSLYNQFYSNLNMGTKGVKELEKAIVDLSETHEDAAKKRALIEGKTTDVIKGFQEKFADLSKKIAIETASVSVSAYEQERIKIRAVQDAQINDLVQYKEAQMVFLKNYSEAQVALETETGRLITDITSLTWQKIEQINQDEQKAITDVMQEQFEKRWGNTIAVARDVMETFQGFIVDFALGVKVSFKDMVDAVGRRILEFTTQVLIVEPIIRSFMELLKGYSTGGGGVLGSILSGLAPDMASFAGGGVISEPVFGVGAKSNKGYMIGEAGPEVVIPADEFSGLGKGGSTNINLTINAVDSKSVTDLLRTNPQAVTIPLVEALSAGDKGLAASIRLAVN